MLSRQVVSGQVRSCQVLSGRVLAVASRRVMAVVAGQPGLGVASLVMSCRGSRVPSCRVSSRRVKSGQSCRAKPSRVASRRVKSWQSGRGWSSLVKVCRGSRVVAVESWPVMSRQVVSWQSSPVQPRPVEAVASGRVLSCQVQSWKIKHFHCYVKQGFLTLQK